MAYEIPLLPVTFPAGFDASAAKHHFVVHDGTDLALCGDGARADGVLYSAPGSGEAGEVQLLGGILRVECGGTIAAGANVASNATGEAVVATTGEVILGRALEAGADGRIISVLTYSGGGGEA